MLLILLFNFVLRKNSIFNYKLINNNQFKLIFN